MIFSVYYNIHIIKDMVEYSNESKPHSSMINKFWKDFNTPRVLNGFVPVG